MGDEKKKAINRLQTMYPLRALIDEMCKRGVEASKAGQPMPGVWSTGGRATLFSKPWEWKLYIRKIMVLPVLLWEQHRLTWNALTRTASPPICVAMPETALDTPP
jgi:hypothetical protein